MILVEFKCCDDLPPHYVSLRKRAHLGRKIVLQSYRNLGRPTALRHMSAFPQLGIANLDCYTHHWAPSCGVT